jgi:hypothetical protein
MLLVTDRARFSGRRLATDAALPLLAFGYSLWAIACAGYEVVVQRLAHSGDSDADAPPTELPGSGRACHRNRRTSGSSTGRRTKVNLGTETDVWVVR